MIANSCLPAIVETIVVRSKQHGLRFAHSLIAKRSYQRCVARNLLVGISLLVAACGSNVNSAKNTPPPIVTVTLAASPTAVASGGASTLTWSSTNATSCTASGGWSGAKATGGTQSTGALTADRKSG